AFEKERNERLGDIANAVARGDVRRHIEALKDYAWVFATLGTDLEDAEKKALQAEEELSKLRPAEDHYQQEIDDTLSLSYLVKGDLEKAFQRIEKMKESVGAPSPQNEPRLAKSQKEDFAAAMSAMAKVRPSGEWHYRYALILASRGKTEEAKSSKEVAK